MLVPHASVLYLSHLELIEYYLSTEVDISRLNYKVMAAPVQLRFDKKVAIVTGGSSGIGEGCVRVFVRNGAKVVFCGLNGDDGQKLQEELNLSGPGECFFMFCDVTKEDQIKELVSTTVTKYGRIDCLINNAGWHPPSSTIDDFSAKDFRDLFELNVMAYFLTAKYSLPHLRQTKGSIINNSSLVNTLGQAGAVTYCSTKGAVSAMTRALAVDEAKHGVRVNAFSPSNVWTPLWEDIVSNSEDKNTVMENGAGAQLLGRFGTIEEAGQLCLFLANEATFCTGIDIPLSGGAELNYGFKSQITNNPYGSWTS